MADSDYVTLAGRSCVRAQLTVGYAGPWHATVHAPSAEALPPPGTTTTLKIGPLSLTGSVVPDSDGTQGLQRKARLIGGAGGWSRDVVARGYHNDAGVKARLIVDDLAREIGETIGTFVPLAERVGVDYARPAGVASRPLQDAIGTGIAWWVDYAGVTHVGARPASTPSSAAYQVLAYDPANRIATLTADDATIVQIGSVLTQGLDSPGTVRELEITAGGEDQLRFTAWLGGTGQEAGRLAGLLAAIAERATDKRLFGLYRYRVLTVAGDGRVDLQSVQPAAGQPDLTRITEWPGLPGTAATLALGSEVLVAFVAGDRAQPVVTHYAPVGASGFQPTQIVIGGTTGMPAARQGDAVEVLLPPMVFVGTVNGLSATGVVSATLPNAVGTITAGSGHVRIAT